MNMTSSNKENSTMIDQEDLINAEAELAQLRQRYRIVENDRRAYLDESSKILRKQRKFIETLEKEKAEFQTDMHVIGCPANQRRENSDLHTMQDLIETCEEGDRQISEEMHKLQMLDKKLSDMAEVSLNHLRIQGGWDAEQVRHLTSRKKIRLLEGKLDKRTIAFNKALSTNNELRAKIHQIRRDLGLLTHTYTTVLKKQSNVKNKMNEIIQLSTAAYESREECLARMSTIRERNEKDEMAYNNEVKDLTRLLAHDQRLKDFMNLKTQDRSDLLKAASERTKQKLAKSSKTCLHQEEIKGYEAVFERLKVYAGEADLDQLVREFLKKEGVAFALFNYKSELDCDVEAFTLRNQSLRKDMKIFIDQGIQLEGQRVNIMKDLEVKVAETTLAADAAQNRYKMFRKDLDNVFRRIVAFIRKLGCDSSTVTNRLGCGGSINDQNAMTYLGLAEFLCNDILLVEAFNQHRRQKKNNSTKKLVAAQQGSVITAKLRPKSPVAVSIVPPPVGEDGEIPADLEQIACSGLDESQPLSPDEIRAKVTRTIERREMKTRNSSKNDWRWQAKSTDPGSPDVIRDVHSGSDFMIDQSPSSERSLSFAKQ
ncbi:coiled-coil domain-containing protein 63-like [Lytechinus variegatus]|uniref:coiled-coil domain-containing protein 63-like n=1 Tax=Lytechinus variegatus TaxID=7654 RepID=UPI001BB21B2B|nr:coiled-coil domain-containing protein 63-like [Lytechinus variegatus]